MISNLTPPPPLQYLFWQLIHTIINKLTTIPQEAPVWLQWWWRFPIGIRPAKWATNKNTLWYAHLNFLCKQYTCNFIDYVYQVVTINSLWYCCCMSLVLLSSLLKICNKFVRYIVHVNIFKIYCAIIFICGGQIANVRGLSKFCWFVQM